MPYLDGWIANASSPIDASVIATRAVDAWNAIQDDPQSITFLDSDGATVAVQTLRVEYDDTTRPFLGSSGIANLRYITLFGVRNHPTVANSVVERGWRFWLGAYEYTTLDPIESDWDVQIRAQRYG